MTIRRPAKTTFGLTITGLLLGLMLAEPVHAQRRIEGQRYGGQRYGTGVLNKNPAGAALGSGRVNTPDGVLGRGAMTYGDALDANLQVGSGGQNYRRPSGYSYQAVQARNLVVTNGVAGGRGFRGDVGYLAPGDFRSLTSGNFLDGSSYAFRRDSALSSLDFVTSNQRADAFNIAQGVGVFQYRRDFTALPEVNNVNAASRIDDAQIRLDRATSTLQTGNLFTTAVAPADIGIVLNADQEYTRMTASPVRGIQYQPADAMVPEDIYDAAMLNDAMIQRQEPSELGLVPQAFDPEQAVPERSLADPANTRIESPASDRSNYERIHERIAQQYEGREDVNLDAAAITRMRQEFGRIDSARIGSSEDERPTPESSRREGLPGDREPLPGLEVGPGDGDDADDPIESVRPGDDGASSESDEDTGTEDGEETRETRSIEELIDALAHRTMVTELVDPGMRVRVAQVVGQAEQAMRDRDYFRAEDRFDLALQLNPGNPMLEAGRANAQVGAGLYRSAAVTLVGLFRKHKDMIDVGFESDLLPTRTRLRLAAQSIEELVAKDPEGSSGLGIVVAYIGRQLGDRAMVRRGLDLIEDPRVTPLVSTLRGVWLSSKAIPGSEAEGGE